MQLMGCSLLTAYYSINKQHLKLFWWRVATVLCQCMHSWHQYFMYTKCLDDVWLGGNITFVRWPWRSPPYFASACTLDTSIIMYTKYLVWLGGNIYELSLWINKRIKTKTTYHSLTSRAANLWLACSNKHIVCTQHQKLSRTLYHRQFYVPLHNIIHDIVQAI